MVCPELLNTRVLPIDVTQIKGNKLNAISQKYVNVCILNSNVKVYTKQGGLHYGLGSNTQSKCAAVLWRKKKRERTQRIKKNRG